MPRVTKKQREAGHTKKKTSSAGRKENPRGGGFKVLPARAPKDAYLGKARKIKANLIEAAKIKKQYAKVLAAEGMSSTRLAQRGSGSNNVFPKSTPGQAGVGRGGAKGGPKVKGKGQSRRGKGDAFFDGSASEDDQDDMDEDEAEQGASDNEQDDEDDGAVSDAESDASDASSVEGIYGLDGDDRMRQRAGPAPGEKPDLRKKTPKSEAPKGKFADKFKFAKGKGKFEDRKGKFEDRKGKFNKFDRSKSDKPRFDKSKPTKERKPTRALSPEAAPATKTEEQVSMRTLKREAFAKHHRQSANANPNLGGRKGQPRMGARMDMLLEKIRRG